MDAGSYILPFSNKCRVIDLRGVSVPTHLHLLCSSLLLIVCPHKTLRDVGGDGGGGVCFICWPLTHHWVVSVCVSILFLDCLMLNVLHLHTVFVHLGYFWLLYRANIKKDRRTDSPQWKLNRQRKTQKDSWIDGRMEERNSWVRGQ